MTRVLANGLDASASAHPPEPGDVLGDKYRIEREIGSGGMGVVYEVTHLVMTEKHFAVKWLLPLPDRPDSARRFIREAKIAGRIRHPHVVDIYDVNIEDDGCFMVMELLEGESLDARLHRVGSLEAHEACRILVACMSGVAAAHAAGVIHRDLKPANIFLCQGSRSEPAHPKVLDFGISRVVIAEGAPETTETRTGTIIGTPSYMAPEQLRGAAGDRRTDVYALGVTLYETLAGARAYEASTYADLVVRIVTGDVADLEDRCPGLPAGLSDVVARAMHPDAARRYPSVEMFAIALQPYLRPDAPRATFAISQTWMVRAASSARVPSVWWIGLGLALALSVALMLWWNPRESDPKVHIVEPAKIVPPPAFVPPPSALRATAERATGLETAPVETPVRTRELEPEPTHHEPPAGDPHPAPKRAAAHPPKRSSNAATPPVPVRQPKPRPPLTGL